MPRTDVVDENRLRELASRPIDKTALKDKKAGT
jgi:hypothetical protein